ncbi:hypothetical protein ABTY61_28085 [Kitasatospora sp. NPDC096128]|uniref:hypothetical protein n=1 Tax=Kitasatospora sp. NPDC096128 TaxID=3155547 RepID=UPI00332ABD41
MNSADFVPPEKRRRGLTIRTYRLAVDGTRSDDTGTVTLNPDDVSPDARHPAAIWPFCPCPVHGGDRDRPH